MNILQIILKTARFSCQLYDIQTYDISRSKITVTLCDPLSVLCIRPILMKVMSQERHEVLSPNLALDRVQLALMISSLDFGDTDSMSLYMFLLLKVIFQ